MRSFSESYRDAGVNIEAGYEGVKLMKKHVQRTMIPGVVSDIGGFGGLFAPDLTGMSEPVLVSGTDGVGTKHPIPPFQNQGGRRGGNGRSTQRPDGCLPFWLEQFPAGTALF